MDKYLCIFFLLFLACSCKYRTDNFTFNESEFYIDEKTVSISSDQLGYIWIGTENGDIYRYNDKKLMHYDLQEDKIYKAMLRVSDFKDTLLWVAARNAGLQVWDIKNRKNPRKIKTYTIDIKGKDYSPYDFIFRGNDIYVSTSLGFYKGTIDNSSLEMKLVYPSKEELSKHPGNIYVFRNLCPYEDSIIWGATTEGLKKYNVFTGKTTTLLDKKNIEHIAIYNDTLYATSKNCLYRITPSQTILSNNIDKQVSMFYKDVNGNNILIGQNYLLLTQDFKRYTDIAIDQKIPVNSNIHNLMVKDTSNAFSFLITDNALWRIASHINIFSGKNINASCANESGDIYFITGLNELYIQEKGSDNAKWVFSFNKQDPITWMDIAGDELYMYSSSNSFYKIKLHDKWYKNIISSPKKLFQTSSKITATHLHKYNNNAVCYIGTQEGLFYLSDDSVKSVPYFSGMYITSFFETKNSDRIYISTLNDGVHFAGNNYESFKKLPESSGIKFIVDIIATNDHRSNLITLTNQHILFEDEDNSIRAKGMKKLIQLNDSSFASIPQRGLNMYVIRDEKIIFKGKYFVDISFNPNACFIANDHLVLGSNVGSLTISPQNMNHSDWTIFGDIISIEVLSAIILIILLLIALIICIMHLYLNKGINIKDALLLKLRDDQINRINDVQPFTNQGSDPKLKEEVSEIQSYLLTLDIDGKTRAEKKEIKERLEKISLRIANINRKISLHFPIRMNEQRNSLSCINNVEARDLIQKIENIGDVDNISIIYNTIEESQLWIDRYESLLHQLELDIESCSHSLVIADVNDGLYENLVELEKNMPNLYLDEIELAYADLDKRLKNIDNNENKPKIRNTIEQMENMLLPHISADKKLLPLEDFLKDIKNSVYTSPENLKILKQLNLLDEQLQVLNILSLIKDYTTEYKKSVDKIIKENNDRINKKNEMYLNSEIETKSQPIAQKINRLITELYSILPKKDAIIVSDILKINNENSQNAKVLALLLADKKIKRTIIPKILGIFGNLNPVISRLVNDRIKPNSEQIKQSRKDNKYSVLIVKISELAGDK